jgi:hypothetical protein
MADEAKVLEELRRASLGTVVEELRAIRELYDAIAGPRSVAPKGPDGANATHDYLVGLTRLALNTYNAYLRLQSDHFDHFAGRLREVGKLFRPADDGAGSETTLTLRGAIGDEVGAGFTIDNERGGIADVSFYTSDFRSGDGRVRVAAPVQITPRAGANRQIAPGARSVFDVAVLLEAALFAGSDRWLAETVVMRDGAVAARVVLSIEVQPGAPAARGGARRRARKGARGKRK